MDELIERLKAAGNELAGFDGSGGLYHEAAQRIVELEAENEHLRKHWTAEKPADLVWNEVDGLHNENDLQRIVELEDKAKEMARLEAECAEFRRLFTQRTKKQR